jgi:hypothetical protein
MKTKNIIRNFSLGLLLFTLSSCGDWLEITPLNDIVLENFWTDKTDVENVVASCYTALLGSDVVSRMLIWGELRSDNMVQGQGIPDAENEILRANILPTNPYTGWTCFYNVINRCNTVLYYAPMVAQKDPNFNESSFSQGEQCEVLTVADKARLVHWGSSALSCCPFSAKTSIKRLNVLIFIALCLFIIRCINSF